MVDAGVTFLTNGSLLVGNRCEADGCNSHSFDATGGVTSYLLPAPPGRWISGLDCRVYRGSTDCQRYRGDHVFQPGCSSQFCRFTRSQCFAHAAACALVPNISASVSPLGPCQPAVFVQPCDWQTLPELVGRSLQTLPQVALGADFPYACAPGLMGGIAPRDQASSTCAGSCPAGHVCPLRPTLEPQPWYVEATAPTRPRRPPNAICRRCVRALSHMGPPSILALPAPRGRIVRQAPRCHSPAHRGHTATPKGCAARWSARRVPPEDGATRARHSRAPCLSTRRGRRPRSHGPICLHACRVRCTALLRTRRAPQRARASASRDTFCLARVAMRAAARPAANARQGPPARKQAQPWRACLCSTASGGLLTYPSSPSSAHTR